MIFSVAIDGPAGAGKSTAAKQLSAMLGAIYLDTGAMYRTVALAAIRRGIDTSDEKALEEMLDQIRIEIKFGDQGQVILLDGEEVNDYIRTPEVSLGASKVAVFPPVRHRMVEMQRDIASRNTVVMDGRDIGTYVLKDARYKFFLTATVEMRAKRRYEEQKAKGMEADIEEIKRDIRFRDENDSSRAMAPLKQAEDAILIDTTNQSIDEMVEDMARYIDVS
ncbi:MAG TPA: (d)CMP kinase [Clostridia bacterium]|nr:(d)CMP kinase [Clostridia bacterium]